MPDVHRRRLVGVMYALTALFLGRVVGQAWVAGAAVTWLPPMDAWYSGLLPYPWLLLAQVVILAGQVKLGADARAGRGLFSHRRPRLARVLGVTSYAYAAAMLGRYAVTQTHAIPVAFHFVLAGYLFCLSRLLAGAGHRRPPDGRRRGHAIVPPKP